MSKLELTPDNIEVYYLNRLDAYRIRHSRGAWYRAQCPIHGGTNPTALSVNLADGHFTCFSCGVKGKDPIAFEMELLRKERGAVPGFDIIKAEIEKAIGQPVERRVYPEAVEGAKKSGWDRSKARDKYVYTNEVGDELFTVWRFVDSRGNKATPPDHPCPDHTEGCTLCENGRCWGAKGVRRVLYRWPDVIQSSLVFVVEGEKNANDLSREIGRYLNKEKVFKFGHMYIDRIGVTTNPGGAMAWKVEYGYGKQFQSKVVIKLGDNDGSGRKHDEDACKDIAPYASKLFTLPLPVGEGEDISDYLQSHTVTEFFNLLRDVVPYDLPAPDVITNKSDSLAPRTLLVKPSDLVVGSDSSDSDWLVDRLIRRGTRGLVVAPPKTGKSLFFLDIALALGCQRSVLSLTPYSRPVRVGIISREDGGQLVHDRLCALARGRNIDPLEVDRNIRVNTEKQSSRFKVDIDADLKEMAVWLKAEQIEFCVIDVLNKLHSGDENSANDMTPIMGKFDELAAMSGAQVCVIHHTSAAGRVRGSTAIEGWADYIFKLEADPQDESMKTLTVKTKASGQVTPRQMRYMQSDDMKESRIVLVTPR